MKKYGIIGGSLQHSFSKKYFTEKFREKGLTGCSYDNYEIRRAEDMLAIISSTPELVGLNVTNPFKVSVMPLLRETDETAEKVGAVNTIKIRHDGSGVHLKGYNTDVRGFGEAILPFLQAHHQHALILGTGGSAKAVAFVLQQTGIQFNFVSRKKSGSYYSYDDLDEQIITNNTFIINASPVGTFPNVDECPPVPFQFITPKHFLFDLVYNPAETLFLKHGKQKGATVQNGFTMLKAQAEASWKIWND